jgi:L-ascorbate metabolism protein UlaG (beta-lactamase superfamily)
MKWTWLGHSTFLLETDAGAKLVTDPVDAGSGFDLPRIAADVITVSHRHFDHCATERIGGTPAIKESTDPETIAGFRITGYPTFHDEVRGAKRGTNTVFSIEADGQRFVHCGDLGHIPDDATIAALKGADVLMIPVGSVYTVDGRTAWEIAKRIAPKVVVPMHYAVPNLRFALEPVDHFLNAAAASPAPIRIEVPTL